MQVVISTHSLLLEKHKNPVTALVLSPSCEGVGRHLPAVAGSGSYLVEFVRNTRCAINVWRLSVLGATASPSSLAAGSRALLNIAVATGV